MLKHLRTLVTNGLLVLASFGVALVAADTVLRLFPELAGEEVRLRLPREGSRATEEGGETRIIIPDDEIGYLYRPHTSRRVSRGGVSFSFTTDRLGFRNPELPDDGAEIVVLGDSMAFGYGVEEDEGWVALLDRVLPDQRVVNLALVGAGPQQYERIHARFGRPFRSRLVLLMLFTGNDLVNALHFESWLEAGRPVKFLEWQTPSQAKPWSIAWAVALLKETHLGLALREARRALRAKYYGHTYEFAGGQRIFLAPQDFSAYQRLTDPESPAFKALIRAAMAIRRMTEADGAELLVVIMPTKEEVYLPLLDELAAQRAGFLARELIARGVWCLDLTSALQARALDEPLYPEIDGHPTATGHAAIAEAILRAIEERNVREEPSGALAQGARRPFGTGAAAPAE